ncbi:MAG: putative bifunctional diguanylate cyclase/phosphodiesterase, partial [Burkholderiaceae bacterium]
PVFNADGSIREWIGTNVDVTVRKRAQEQVARSAERLMLATDAANLGVWVWDFANNEVTWENERLYEMFGVPKSDGPVTFARFISEVLHPDDLAPYKKMMTSALENNTPFRYEGRFYRQPDQALRWFEFTGLIHRNEDGAPLRIVGTAADITERKEAEEKLRHASLHDPLTGLPNRTMLIEVAGRVLAHNRRVNRAAAVLYLDLDRFKPINDTHGHEFGDAVLKEVAGRLSQSLRAEDIVVRVGGDEFVILLQEVDNAAVAGDVAAHIVALINEPFRVGDLTLSLSTSVGISVFPVDGEHIDALVTHADMAMYQAKQAGRNRLQFYSSEFAAEARLQAGIEQRLKSALRTDAFHLYYQPVVDIRNGRMVSVEALLRWRGVDIGPDRFVPVAEASGIINPIGAWVLQEASRQHRLWRAHGLPTIPVAVNVSVVEFRAKDFVPRFMRMLGEHGIDVAGLQLEVTETAIMDDIDHAAQVLSELKALGVAIALDDFGTGQSSLAYLARLPLNKIKIDKSFISRIESDVASRAVTDAMIALGRTLNLEVVAEGVEAAAVLDYLQSRGCQQAQGYYFGRPMSGEALEAWYRERTASVERVARKP